jgi:hypothetical protein
MCRVFPTHEGLCRCTPKTSSARLSSTSPRAQPVLGSERCRCLTPSPTAGSVACECGADVKLATPENAPGTRIVDLGSATTTIHVRGWLDYPDGIGRVCC